jgi:hypothetical protein
LKNISAWNMRIIVFFKLFSHPFVLLCLFNKSLSFEYGFSQIFLFWLA